MRFLSRDRDGSAPSGTGTSHRTHDAHGHNETCACGKNGTPEAHGAVEREVRGGGTRVLDAMPCEDVLAIRARVAADITRAAMNPAQRALAWMQGRGGEYTDAAYQAAWAAPSTTPAQVDGAAR